MKISLFGIFSLIKNEGKKATLYYDFWSARSSMLKNSWSANVQFIFSNEPEMPHNWNVVESAEKIDLKRTIYFLNETEKTLQLKC